jgi:methionine-rich copper-binding protein CopC
MIRTRRSAALLLALAMAHPRGALSHSLLLGSDPAEGAVLTTPPTGLTLRFNEAVRLTALRLFEGDGAEWPLQRPRDMAPRAEHAATLGRAPTPGPWRVVWRAISADGHEIGGTLRFQLEPPR